MFRTSVALGEQQLLSPDDIHHDQTAGKAQMEREEKVAYGMSGKEIVFFGKKD